MRKKVRCRSDEGKKSPMEMMYESGSNKVNDLKFKLHSVTLGNNGMAVTGKYSQIKKLYR